MNMQEISREKKSGCGLCNAVFGRNTIWRRKSISTISLKKGGPVKNLNRVPTQKRRRNCSDEEFLGSSNGNKQVDRIIERPVQNRQKSPPVNQQRQAPYKEQLNYGSSGPKSQQAYVGQPRKMPQGTLAVSGEIDSFIEDDPESSTAGSILRGNLGRRGTNINTDSKNILDHLPKPTKAEPSSVMGNIVKKKEEQEKTASICRALSKRVDPEEFRILGNEHYKNGRFDEALASYDVAIRVDTNKASYRINKSAALTALGKLLEAAFECQEAIRIDPLYQRAHNRLAILYLRLGASEKAACHFKKAGQEADPDAMNKLRKVQIHINKCTEAKRQQDWNTVLKETGLSIAAGADSAPLIFALRAEVLLKMNKHQEAIETMEKGPNFDIEEFKKIFGSTGSTSLWNIRAQVNMVAGRFDDAVASAERALTHNPYNNETIIILRRVKAVAKARSRGNELYKARKHSEACIAYGEGLYNDPHNAVLLCNRAACKSKLGQVERAIEDCNRAINVRPGYSKARLRRADCYAKMEKWEACLQDCEVLISIDPGDEEIGKMLMEAKARLGNDRGGQNTSSPRIIIVSSNERFRDYVTSPGLSVVLFYNKQGDRKAMEFIEQLNKKYPSVNFLKVEAEDHPSLVKYEGINSLPAFIIYKNGSREKEIPVDIDNYNFLESSIKYYVTS